MAPLRSASEAGAAAGPSALRLAAAPHPGGSTMQRTGTILATCWLGAAIALVMFVVLSR